jgi:aspartyl protease family protein
MKKILLLLLLVISVLSNAQTTIKMEKDGGVYKIQCKVNGAPMKMYFDTGASTVSISKATAMYLINNDLIDESDFIGTTKSALADGSVVDKMVIRLKDIEIGNLHLKNVEATVSSSLNAPLLLGQTVISKLGKITLNGDILIIHDSKPQTISKDNRDELDSRLRELRADRKDKDADYQILDIIKKIERNNELNEYELFCKVMAEGNLNNYDDAIIDAKAWLDKYGLDTDSIDMRMRVYYVSAKTNLFSEKGDKELGKQHLERCRTYFERDTTAHFFWNTLPSMILQYCKFKNTGYSLAIFEAKKVLNHYLQYEGVSIRDINRNKHSNIQLAYCFFDLGAMYIHEIKKIQEVGGDDNYLLQVFNLCYVLSAKLGLPDAIEYCNQVGVDYKKILTQKELDILVLDKF